MISTIRAYIEVIPDPNVRYLLYNKMVGKNLESEVGSIYQCVAYVYEYKFDPVNAKYWSKIVNRYMELKPKSYV